MKRQAAERQPIPWGTRILAGLGFALAVCVLAVLISRQAALASAETYLREKYAADAELPVKGIRPEFRYGAGARGRPLPPLGFCWTIQFQAGPAEAEVTLNPWTHEIIAWRLNGSEVGSE